MEEEKEKEDWRSADGGGSERLDFSQILGLGDHVPSSTYNDPLKLFKTQKKVENTKCTKKYCQICRAEIISS